MHYLSKSLLYKNFPELFICENNYYSKICVILSGPCKGWNISFNLHPNKQHHRHYYVLIKFGDLCLRLSKLHHFFCNQIFFQKQKTSQKFEVLSWLFFKRLVLVILLIAHFVTYCRHLFQITNLII